MESALNTALKGPVSVLNRMRLACTTVGVDGQRLACDQSGTSRVECRQEGNSLSTDSHHETTLETRGADMQLGTQAGKS